MTVPWFVINNYNFSSCSRHAIIYLYNCTEPTDVCIVYRAEYTDCIYMQQGSYLSGLLCIRVMMFYVRLAGASLSTSLQWPLLNTCYIVHVYSSTKKYQQERITKQKLYKISLAWCKNGWSELWHMRCEKQYIICMILRWVFWLFCTYATNCGRLQDLARNGAFRVADSKHGPTVLFFHRNKRS